VNEYLQLLQESAQFLKGNTSHKPKTAIVLGSGYQSFVKNCKIIQSFDFQHIPHFPVPTVEGHGGRLILAEVNGEVVWIQQGRVHYYEGFDIKMITFGIRLFQLLEVENILLTNSCGGVAPTLKTGAIVLISDHINLQPDNPLRGPNLDDFGPRFPDMSNAYDTKLLHHLKSIATNNNIEVSTGVYAAVTGPNYETGAEAKYLHFIGADVVGMSTVPETIIAVHGGMKVAGISCVTDIAGEDLEEALSHDQVLKEAEKAMVNIGRLIWDFVKLPN